MTFLEHLDAWRRQNDVSLLGYVIMPDHVHLVLHPRLPLKMGQAIGRLKSVFAFEIIAAWKQAKAPRLDRLLVKRGGKIKYAFWETRCYDHNCRTPESARTKIQYCHMNPVKAELVAAPEDWIWSSYRWYCGNGESLISIDTLADLC